MNEPEILHLDNHLLVIHKPAGWLSQEDRTGDVDLLSWGKAWLKREFDKPGNVFLGLVHRLDRPVSGVMVLARTSKSASRLSEQFRAREVSKRYTALLAGGVAAPVAWRDFLLKADEQVKVASPQTPGAREAWLEVRPLAQTGQRTRVEVDLWSGRGHQIRVQCAHHGHPVVGDTRYGGPAWAHPGRIALHAHYLAFQHPTQGQRLEFTAPPPF